MRGCSLSFYIPGTALQTVPGAGAVVEVEMNWVGIRLAMTIKIGVTLSQDMREGIFLRMETSRRVVCAA